MQTHHLSIFSRGNQGKIPWLRNVLIMGAWTLLRNSLLGVLFRPGLTVEDPGISLGFLISMGILGFWKNQRPGEYNYHTEQSGLKWQSRCFGPKCQMTYYYSWFMLFFPKVTQTNNPLEQWLSELDPKSSSFSITLELVWNENSGDMTQQSVLTSSLDTCESLRTIKLRFCLMFKAKENWPLMSIGWC